MPTKPQVRTITNVASDVLNYIRQGASQNYKDYVPVATADADSVRAIGAVLMDYPGLRNEFLNSLVNRIALVRVTSKMYSNPLAILKKGKLDYGETIEEIFVNIAKPFTFDPDTSVTDQYKREIPDVRAAFHVMNFQKYYKVTISDSELRQAFLSWDGVNNLITKIIESMYTAAEYDEFEVTKYMIARNILDGHVYAEAIAPVSADSMTDIVATIKGVSNDYTFMNSKHNLAGVKTHTDRTSQYVLINSHFDARMDVQVLAAAFNMSKAEFMGNRLMIDSFGSMDKARLAEIFKGDPNYHEISAGELEALDAIPVMLIDRDYLQIYDNLYEVTDKYNGEGLYRNYWYHTWKTFSISPFSQATVFVPATPSVTNVTVSPSAVTASVGQTVQLTATVTTENFAPQSVNWTSDSDTVTVDSHGKVSIEEGASGSIEITATSTFDNTKTGTSTITIS